MKPHAPQHFRRPASAIRAALGAALAFALWLDAAAQSTPPIEYQVKAAFVFNLARFVEWPAQKFSTPDEPFVIGIVGDDPFEGALDGIVQGKTVNHHPIEIRRLTLGAEFKQCHILFISRSLKKSFNLILAETRADHVLTVSEIDRFAERGGAVGLLLEDENVKLEISRHTAEAAGLKMNSQLLRVARLAPEDLN